MAAPSCKLCAARTARIVERAVWQTFHGVRAAAMRRQRHRQLPRPPPLHDWAWFAQRVRRPPEARTPSRADRAVACGASARSPRSRPRTSHLGAPVRLFSPFVWRQSNPALRLIEQSVVVKE
jgi:hypothetical protein